MTRPKVLVTNVILPISRFLLIVLFIVAGLGETGIAIAFVVSYGIAAAIGLYYVKDLLPSFSAIQAKRKHKELLTFSAPLLIGGVTSIVITDLDILMIGYFLSPKEAGIYKAVYPLSLLLNMVLISFGYLLMPVISELYSENAFERMQEVYQLTAKWTFAFSLPLFLIIVSYSKVLLQTIFGAEYVDGHLALVIISVAFLAHALTGPNGDALKSVGKTKVAMYNSVVLAVSNIILNLLLIPKFSIVGAAIATTLSYIFNNALDTYFLYDSSGMHPFSKGMVSFGLASILVYSVLYFILNRFMGQGFLTVLFNIVIFALVYAYIIIEIGDIFEEITRFQDSL